jgi:hypothetical protein
VALCQAWISTKPLWGFPQVILIIPSHVPNNNDGIYKSINTPELDCSHLSGLDGNRTNFK